MITPVNVLFNLNFSQFYALLDRDEAEFVGFLSESNELFFVIIFIHERCHRVNHFGNCAEAIAKAV
jgi:hypothetical protein